MSEKLEVVEMYDQIQEEKLCHLQENFTFNFYFRFENKCIVNVSNLMSKNSKFFVKQTGKYCFSILLSGFFRVYSSKFKKESKVCYTVTLSLGDSKMD